MIAQSHGGLRALGTVWIASSLGIYTKLAGTWTAMLVGYFTQIVSPLGAPNLLYAFHGPADGASAAGLGVTATLWRSADTGASWTDISGSLPATFNVGIGLDSATFLSVSDAGVLYLSTQPGLSPGGAGVLWSSADGGASWATLDTGSFATRGQTDQGVNDATDGAVSYVLAKAAGGGTISIFEPFTSFTQSDSGAAVNQYFYNAIRTVRGTGKVFGLGGTIDGRWGALFDFAAPGSWLTFAPFDGPGGGNWVEPAGATTFYLTTEASAGAGLTAYGLWKGEITGAAGGDLVVTWTDLSGFVGTTDTSSIEYRRAIAVDPVNPLSIAYVLAFVPYLVSSLDGGATWGYDPLTFASGTDALNCVLVTG